MDRRDFVKTAGLTALTAGAVLYAAGCERKQEACSDETAKPLETAAPAVVTRKTYEWKMVTTWPKNFPGLGTGANQLAQNIEAMSDGRIKIKVYGAGELVPPFESFEAVSNGTAQMGHAASYYWKGKSEAAQFFCTVPFGLNAQEMAAWLRYGGGQELWDQIYADFNLKPFPCGNTGVQMGGWFNKEINSLSDYEGLKMRMPGLGGEVIQRAGANAINLPGGEIFQAMQSGTIDATEWVGPYNDLAFGLHKVAKYYYWPGWHEPGSVMECFINKKEYEALPADLQAILQIAMQGAYHDMLAEFTARNNTSLVELVETYHVTLKRFSDEILKKMGELSKDVLAEVAAKDSASAKVAASFDKFRKQCGQWNHIGEEGYSLARALTFG
ncbi:MAG: TRAP transporter substrate-binding protein [SAR324 cluster bacterium]|nr:TRAP transporter substrate-binding protein [SAR324 cluster bacterium]